MNIDLLPFNAFALESCQANPASADRATTLTLALALGPVMSNGETASGTAYAGKPNDANSSILRAAVVAPRNAPVTITFSALS